MGKRGSLSHLTEQPHAICESAKVNTRGLVTVHHYNSHKKCYTIIRYLQKKLEA